MDATPFVPFKTNANPNKRSPEIWTRLYKYFKENEAEFNEHYHKRSNVETTFYMIKSRLGEFLRSKRHTSQKNELMMKFICHNICCIIQEVYENEIHINFKRQLQSFVNLERKDFTVKVKNE
jgi:transposase